MPKFFRKITKKIKGPWPDTGADARMNPKISLLCGSLALAIMGLAAIRVTYSLYNIQIQNGETYRQLAAKQQLLDTTIKATRGEIYDTSGITLASTSVEETAGRLGLMKIDQSQITYIRLGESDTLERTQSAVRQWTDFIYNGAVNILGTIR